MPSLQRRREKARFQRIQHEIIGKGRWLLWAERLALRVIVRPNPAGAGYLEVEGMSKGDLIYIFLIALFVIVYFGFGKGGG